MSDLSATYAGTTGWSGTVTSEAQARSPKHAHVQRGVLIEVEKRMEIGLTVADLRRIYPDLHHGSLSSALTNLHRDGKLARLEDKRDRCHIYVLPGYVNGRVTQPAGRVRPATDPAGAQDHPVGSSPQTADLAAYDRAWQDGYDQGAVEGREQAQREVEVGAESLLKAHSDGVKAGRRQFAVEVLNHVTETRKLAVAPVVAHFPGCYRQHPRCAIDMFGKIAERELRGGRKIG